MAKKSAGILMYRINNTQLEVLLVHPGGPYWKNKDEGSWSIPKGEYEVEDALEAAKREFFEETGLEVTGELISLDSLKQKSGKVISAWAFMGDVDVSIIKSNTFAIEWPPKSGKMQEFPEVDRAEWFDYKTSKIKISSGQLGFINTLYSTLLDKNIINLQDV